MHKWGKSLLPRVITVFSAPNYCGTYKNRAAVLMLQDNTLNLKQFNSVDTPYTLPDDLNLFEWSMPFLAEKVTAMLQYILCMCSKKELRWLDSSEEAIKEELVREITSEQAKIDRKIHFVKKLQQIAQVSKHAAQMKGHSETILSYQQYAPDGKMCRDSFIEQKPKI